MLDKNLSLFLVTKKRKLMGIPEWDSVQNWLSKDNVAPYPKEKEEKEGKLENSEIPTLDSYEGSANKEFWEKFPKNELPKKASTKINIRRFEKEIEKVKGRMTKMELKRANRVIKDLKFGAEAYQKRPELPPITVPNAKTSVTNGKMLSDKIGTWVKKGIVSGPFICPPLKGFRANPLGTICKNGKTRPIMNMSSPVGQSFNDNMDLRKMEKVHMSTAKEFSHGLLEAGKNAVFSKFDICDAYKLVPAKPEDLRLQGFKWLERYFVENQMTFGSRASVCNFDRLANTKDLIVCLNSATPKDKVFRVLDDSPCVAPEKSEITENFGREMRRLCGAINLPLAQNCPKKEKAFECEKQGVVLGIGFNSSNMTWNLPEEKADKVIKRCLEARNSKHMDLNQTQKLMGSVNDLAQMCPIMKYHKGTGNRYLEQFKGRDNILIPTQEEFKEDMRIIANMADLARVGMPIARADCKPPLSHLVFYSDAAGGSFSKVDGKVVFHDQEQRGVCCLGGEEIQDIWAGGRIKWPEGLVSGKKDEKGVPFGFKSTFLESVGILIPFLICPKAIMGRDITFRVDNIAVMYGWNTGYVKCDKSASEVLKCAAYLAAFTGTTLRIEHVPRVSDEMANLADELSRKREPEKENVKRILKSVGFTEIKGTVRTWLENPCSGRDLTSMMLKELMGKIHS